VRDAAGEGSNPLSMFVGKEKSTAAAAEQQQRNGRERGKSNGAQVQRSKE
jgi:hypothetical protein